MYGLKPVPFKCGTLLFLELWSTGFAVISVHPRGMEIAQIRPSLILPLSPLISRPPISHNRRRDLSDGA